MSGQILLVAGKLYKMVDTLEGGLEAVEIPKVPDKPPK